MYPDLLQIFGVTLYGVLFERILWGVGILLMVWGLVSTVSIYLKGRRNEAIGQGVFVLALLVWLVPRFIGTFGADYSLVFLKPVVLHSYAFCILVGIACGIGSAMWMAPRRGIDRMWIAKLCLWFVLIGFVGARIVHVIVEYQFYLDSCVAPERVGLDKPDCLRVLNVSEGGLTFYGGVISGFAVLAVACIRQKRRNPDFSIPQLIDILAVALAVTHGFGRIGCLAAGCCWGAVTESGWGIHYGPGSFAFIELARDPAFAEALKTTGHTPGMHPSQLYESFGEFALYGVMCLIARKQHAGQEKRMIEAGEKALETNKTSTDSTNSTQDTAPESTNSAEAAAGTKLELVTGPLSRLPHPGLISGIWFFSYGALRFVVEMVRSDTERGYFFEKSIEPLNRVLDVSSDHVTVLTTSQGIASFMMAVGVLLLFYSFKKRA